MKNNKLSIKHILSICIVLFTIMYQTKTFELKASAILSFYNSKVKLNGPVTNNFKGNVNLDESGRGIVITAGDGAHDESMLRLVSEKMESDRYLIDYRLFRTCEVTASFSPDKEKLTINFSPFSLENRKKNDNFDINVEISNYENLFDKSKYSKETDIQSFINDQCATRKTTIANFKKDIITAVKSFRVNSKELEAVNDELRSHAKNMESLKASIGDTESQLKDIDYLKNSYQMQLKSISSLTTGASKLIVNETKKKEELLKEQKDIEDQINRSQIEAKKQEEILSKLKEKYAKNMESTKDIENTIINAQKNISDLDNSLSNVRSEQLRINYDLKNVESHRTTIEKSLDEITAQTKELLEKSEKFENEIKNMIKDKEQINLKIIEEKQQIEKMESEINQLIQKKSQKEESLKNKFDQIKNLDDNLTNKKLESEQISCTRKSLLEKKERLEGSEKLEIVEKIENLKSKIKSTEEKENSLSTLKNKLNDEYNEANNQKELLIKKIAEYKKRMDLNTNQFMKINKKINTMDKNKNDIFKEIRKEEFKIKNLRMESQNYNGEIENINKSINSADENYKTFQEIMNDLISKKAPTEQSYNSLSEQKNKKENSIHTESKKIKELSEKLKKEVPSATVMVDLAQDEAFNNLNEAISENSLDTKPKWQTLIEKIIS